MSRLHEVLDCVKEGGWLFFSETNAVAGALTSPARHRSQAPARSWRGSCKKATPQPVLVVHNNQALMLVPFCAKESGLFLKNPSLPSVCPNAK